MGAKGVGEGVKLIAIVGDGASVALGVGEGPDVAITAGEGIDGGEEGAMVSKGNGVVTGESEDSGFTQDIKNKVTRIIAMKMQDLLNL